MNKSTHSALEIFTEALEIADLQGRTQFVGRMCRSDAALRREVEELLAAEAAAGQFLPDQPADSSVEAFFRDAAGSLTALSVLDCPAGEQPGDWVGPYKLLHRIGEGGCGVVYLAEQEKPIRRQVALKVIKLGMETRSVMARFEAERQALALMDHPSIARVFDAGATSSGRPFFVMELVRGLKITEHCDRQDLSIRQRIELFLQVCQAVQHAHQKGIIHRDLKPSNILVTVRDDVALPKVIDFGVAKATAGRLTDQTLFTGFQHFIGTPAYMSPEQAAMAEDIDTRSDVYSLGVLLYELLTGKTPFDTKELLRSGVDVMRQIIQEKEPVRPSTRIRQIGECDDSSPGAKAVIRAPRFALASDLDWIVLKCLEKDRSARYQTAAALAGDLERHLKEEPILARPPNTLYRVRKFARRNKAIFAAAASGLIALVVGMSLAIAGFVQARQQRDLSNLRAYTAHMNLVQEVWEEGNLLRAQTLLKKYIPDTGDPDLRGFEWRYLQNLCRDESRFAFTNFPAEVRIAFSPDGRFLAAGSGRLVKLLDYANGRELDTLALPAEARAMTAMAFLPTNTNILATVSQHTLLFWSLASKSVTGTIPLSNTVFALAFSRNGKFLATVGEANRTVQLWRVEDRSLLWARQSAQWPESLAFAPDGESLITAGGALAEPLAWDLAAGSSTSFPSEHRARVNSIDFSSDGRLMATAANDGTVILWDFSARKLLDRLIAPAAGTVNAIAFSPDGRWLATGNADSTVRLWDVAKRQQKTLYRGHRSEILQVAFSPDGRSIISSSWDRTVRVWDLEPRSREDILFSGNEWVRTSVFSPDSKRLATTEIQRGVLKVWDVATRSMVAELGTAANDGGAAAYSPDGRILVQVSGRLIQLWDAPTLTLSASFTNDFDSISLAFSPDSRTLALCGPPHDILEGVTDRLAFWDLTALTKINKLATAAPHASIVSFSHDGQKIGLGYVHGGVRLWDYETGKLLAEFTDQRQRIWGLAFSPDDNWLVAAGEDGVVAFHDLRARRTFCPIRTSMWISGLCFSPDGKTLASFEADGTVRLWNFATREIALELKGHIGLVSVDSSFSPDTWPPVARTARCGFGKRQRFRRRGDGQVIPLALFRRGIRIEG